MSERSGLGGMSLGFFENGESRCRRYAHNKPLEQTVKPVTVRAEHGPRQARPLLNCTLGSTGTLSSRGAEAGG